MKTKIVKEKEQETVLSKKNYIILIIGSILIIAGYILMSGEGSTLAAYNPNIFSGINPPNIINISKKSIHIR